MSFVVRGMSFVVIAENFATTGAPVQAPRSSPGIETSFGKTAEKFGMTEETSGETVGIGDIHGMAGGGKLRGSSGLFPRV